MVFWRWRVAGAVAGALLSSFARWSLSLSLSFVSLLSLVAGRCLLSSFARWSLSLSRALSTCHRSNHSYDRAYINNEYNELGRPVSHRNFTEFF